MLTVYSKRARDFSCILIEAPCTAAEVLISGHHLTGADPEVKASGECHICEESRNLYPILRGSQF